MATAGEGDESGRGGPGPIREGTCLRVRPVFFGSGLLRVEISRSHLGRFRGADRTLTSVALRGCLSARLAGGGGATSAVKSEAMGSERQPLAKRKIPRAGRVQQPPVGECNCGWRPSVWSVRSGRARLYSAMIHSSFWRRSLTDDAQTITSSSKRRRLAGGRLRNLTFRISTTAQPWAPSGTHQTVAISVTALKQVIRPARQP